MEGVQEPAPAPGPPDMDVVTQIQEHIALLCSRFFNFIGALQRDAPPAPLHIAAAPDPREEEVQVGAGVASSPLLRSARPTLTIRFTAEPDQDHEDRDLGEPDHPGGPHTAAA